MPIEYIAVTTDYSEFDIRARTTLACHNWHKHPQSMMCLCCAAENVSVNYSPYSPPWQNHAKLKVWLCDDSILKEDQNISCTYVNT